jgi:hypothetical protein
MPPLTDTLALTGIGVVLTAWLLRLLAWRWGFSRWTMGWAMAFFILLWLPVGIAGLPLLAYVRGVSSDLSVTLVSLGLLRIYAVASGRATDPRELRAVAMATAATALVLYPTALGLGDWDAYRLGWGGERGWVLWGTLLAASLAAWSQGLRLLPMLVSLALLAWTAGLLESTNLWDYLVDPWLATACIVGNLMMPLKFIRIPGRQRAPESSPGSRAMRP